MKKIIEWHDFTPYCTYYMDCKRPCIYPHVGPDAKCTEDECPIWKEWEDAPEYSPNTYPLRLYTACEREVKRIAYLEQQREEQGEEDDEEA